ncbi:potassium-transporting ATPase subunit KdpC [Ligilactobacillus sp. WILCCON 0076]|uniref:Potassium-transporting ATPase KdpC subunit n=1 Tax=Ligilactobacillus ubinensis TaxID=2876789 RepID=A0A9X2FIU6_9LACO|nr:potassium-transporting ATPase subunit KdpC [Ligilactobacillus ubinensis]MCP0886627.1 potassium-transporting ATPase subunit KdpC [Ligilactobacillus ubinensis]
MINVIKDSIKALIVATLLTIIYTLVVTMIGQAFFNKQANGSILTIHNRSIGSKLIAQPFTEKKYLWGRNMIIDTNLFKTSKGQTILYASASNLSQTSTQLIRQVRNRAAIIKKLNPGENNVPIDLVTTSGSGLDPEISPQAAFYQAKRIARARDISIKKVNKIIKNNIVEKTYGIFGENRVNVLEVNIALDRISK